ncbi:MAG: type secretion system protein VirB6 [Sphingomonadales bacterium]|nr:type secretion system protein VirB6 [Sphingomonadales bacterium]
MACAVIPPDTGFVRAMVAFIDCQAQSLGAQGYLALLAPGSTLSLVLTGFLTLLVALLGYRLLLGHAPDVREGVFTLVKIGFVLALATSWPAYRALVYDVALRGPAELTAEIGAPSGLPGAGGGLVDRLDTVDQAMAALALLGAGEPPLTVAPPAANDVATPQTPPPPFAGFNAFALGGSRLIFLLGAVGALAVVRLVAGLMLALGPFFIAFLLFDQTRGLFEGWVRVLAGAALAALGTAVTLGLELALLEPWLADILTRRAAGEALPNMPAEILLVTSMFALLLLAMMFATARLAFGFRLVPGWRAAAGRLVTHLRAESASQPAAAATAAAAAEGRSRAAIVVDAISSAQRREAAQGGAATVLANAYAGDVRPAAAARAGRDLPDRVAPAPLGQSFRRSTRTRVSAGARRRDRQS